MDNKNSKNPIIPISVILAFCTALGVVYYSQAPLKGIRPTIQEMQEGTYSTYKIPARLWQDPFQAVLDQKKAKVPVPRQKTSAPNFQPLRHEIEKRLPTENVTVLGVMVSGTAFDEEIRLRTRYAILSGLHRSNFVPEDADHINCIDISQFQEGLSPTKNIISISNILPYEWFIYENSNDSSPKNKSVLVLWINNDAIPEKPLAKLASMISQLRFPGNNPNFKIIGPAGSKSLQKMLKELKEATELRALAGAPPGELDTFSFVQKMRDAAPRGYFDLVNMLISFTALMETDKYSQLNKVEIYSAKATADVPFLLPQKPTQNQKISEATIVEAFKDWGIEFRRTICSDKQLVQELVKELKRRGLGPGDHIALITEWDTLYGRSFQKTFENALETEYEPPGFFGPLNKFFKHVVLGRGKAGVTLRQPKGEVTVHWFSYLRTLDGKLPGERDGTGKEQQKNSNDHQADKDHQEMEKPLGRCQYDYIRRLTDSIYELDKQLGQGTIIALGVMGSEFYDKHLLIQALYQRFPERIFFTTDLDARLLHPATIQYARNLVVASGYGLQLHRDFQGDIPPFRDVYQTSIFHATLQALKAPENPKDPKDLKDSKNSKNPEDVKEPLLSLPLLQNNKLPPPRMFELGYKSAVDITAPSETEIVSDEVEELGRLHPRRQLVEFHREHLFVIPIIPFSFVFLWFLSSTARSWTKGTWQFLGKHPEVLILSIVVIAYIYFGIIRDPSQEPFSFTEGVSIYPTHILRLLAVALSWCFYFYSIGMLRENDQRLQKEFGLWSFIVKKPPTTSGFKLQRWWPYKVWRKMGDFLAKCFGLASPVDRKKKKCQGWAGNCVNNWYQEIRCYREQDDVEDSISVNRTWQEYFRNSMLGFRPKTIRFLVFLYLAISLFIIIAFGPPITPARGNLSFVLHGLILFAMIFSFLWLTFFVFYNTSLFYRFVHLFANKEPVWDKISLDTYGNKKYLNKKERSDWMLMQLIAKRTEVVGNLIYFPFIIWLISCLSRASYFDNWHAPYGLVIVIFLSALLAWSCGFRLRRAAESLRAKVIERLGAAASTEENEKRIKDLQKEIADIRKGAFAPYLQNPVVNSLLATLGGWGGLQLLPFLERLM